MEEILTIKRNKLHNKRIKIFNKILMKEGGSDAMFK